MNRGFFLGLLLIFSSSILSGRKDLSDSLETIKLDEVVIAANRVPVLLKNNPGAVSLVTPEVLSGMPKTAGAEEALRLIPGVRIDKEPDPDGNAYHPGPVREFFGSIKIRF